MKVIDGRAEELVGNNSGVHSIQRLGRKLGNKRASGSNKNASLSC